MQKVRKALSPELGRLSSLKSPHPNPNMTRKGEKYKCAVVVSGKKATESALADARRKNL